MAGSVRTHPQPIGLPPLNPSCRLGHGLLLPGSLNEKSQDQDPESDLLHFADAQDPSEGGAGLNHNSRMWLKHSAVGEGQRARGSG